MPVENVQLHGGHGIDVAEDDGKRHPVTGGIDHEAAPREARAIFDVDGGSGEALFGRCYQLGKGLDTAEGTVDGGGVEGGALGGDVEGVRFVFAKGGIIGSA